MKDSNPPEPQRVLVVDDNRDLADNVAEIFTHHGVQARAVYDGESARQVAGRDAFDLAIVDVALPDDTGVAVSAYLKERQPHAEVVLMTANATLDTAIAAVRGGIYAYVQKPFDSDELVALCSRALAQIQLRRERSRLERELVAASALYRGVVDSVDAFIVGLNPDGEVRMWNRSAERATGRSRRSVIGNPLGDLLISDHSRKRLDEALSAVAAGQVVSQLELTVKTAEGHQRLLRWNLRQLQRAEEASDLVLAVGEDLTDRLELERRAAEAEAMASLGALTAGLAHEIRNPLNAAALQLELLRRAADKLDEEKTRKGIETRVGIVREELSRLTNLLDDFLNLAKPRGLSLTPVNLCAVVEEVLALEEPAATRAGVRIRTHREDEHLMVLADPPMLKQVLVNLLVNAIDAMRPRGRGEIHVRCHRLSDQRIELGVEDNGPGVPPEIAGKLFSPFVTSKEAGTGLGLTIVKRIVDRHGGTISVSSVPNEGTTVRVSLTRAQ